MSQHAARFVLLHTRSAYQSLLERAAQHYRERPEATAVVFVPVGNAPHRLISYREFFDNAARYAETLRGIGIGRHDLAILVMDHSEALLYAFWGALMLGAMPSIFPFLSDKLDPTIYFERVRLLISHSGAKVVIASAQYAESLAALNTGVPIVSESALQPSEGAPQFNFEVRGEDIAFLQHSSGTTGLQKGVALSHGAVLNQIASYSEAIRLREDDCIVSWLPLYHDMGLIAAFVLPLVQGIPLVLISPHHWVRDPKVMLHAISQYRGTLCWLPNFAYNFLAQRVRDNALEGVSLASMRAFINCSEPMRADSHRQFAARYAPYGVKPEMLATCYAMAENTFAVTQGGIDSLPNIDLISREALSTQHIARPAVEGELAIEMLSCGTPIPNCEIQIVDEARQPLPERHVGEVAVRSDSMLSGYYRRPDLTEQAMFNGWYLTGDYGYIANGELYITGRKKDLIIVGGKNIYPQDLEAIANEVKGVKAGRTVAFGVEDERLGTESIVMVCEAETDDEDERFEIARQVRMRVAQETDVTLGDVYIVDAKWLLKTSSGKIARGANREKYLRERNAQT
ncbi:MAG: AMP-binding protein [Anaerolineae bacterium]|nr:AMP-binding protein [Anaerolineae bacterium]MDW8298211.1 AMP-binding protein [Anaerolineae bacterium]